MTDWRAKGKVVKMTQMRMLRRVIPFGISLLATPVALFAGLVSVGAGHGNYILASLFFPFAFIFASIAGPLFPCPEFGDCFPRDDIMLASAIIQFPLYGLLFSIVKRKALLAAFLVIIHVSFFVVFWLRVGTLGFY